MLNKLSHLKKLSIESTFHPINWTHLPTAAQKTFLQLLIPRQSPIWRWLWFTTSLSLRFAIYAVFGTSKCAVFHSKSPRITYCAINPSLRDCEGSPSLILGGPSPFLRSCFWTGFFCSLVVVHNDIQVIGVINKLLELSSDSLSELELNPLLIGKCYLFFGSKFTNIYPPDSSH